MKIDLTPEMEELVRRLLARGKYKDADEVVFEGLRLLAEEGEWRADLQRRVQEGLNQIKAGSVLGGRAIDDLIRGLQRSADEAAGE